VARRGPGRLRVVAGRAGGRRLESLPGEATRPTTERVREAVFSSLGSDTVGASVLDLYAGTGALAIEALSRGAAHAVLVDADRAAAELCRRNLAATDFADAARVVDATTAAFVALLPPSEAPFTLVTCDPPYATPDAEVEAVLIALTVPGWLAPGAIAVIERGVRTPVEPVPSGWRLRFARVYGDTLVTLLTAGESDPAT
jgi:16S rRNA (guanine966-N2)-methyltransferase